MRPYVQEIIDLTKQVDDLTSDNVDLKEQLNNCQSELVIAGIKGLKDRNQQLDQMIDILWEYISKNDIEKIEERFENI